ncbi:hypothetical protein Tco_1058697 [Tanacetum coccineum]|uniref:Uncharacterized protein n=1 Tax=Tanacetum coccineum TaxID=301880 RepID=A0ABQ5H9L7_9ASTR
MESSRGAPRLVYGDSVREEEEEAIANDDGAHDKEGTGADVSALDWLTNDWLAPEGTGMLPADQSSAPVSLYHVPLGHILEKP